MSQKIRALIVDDEERARRVLSNIFDQFFSEIEVIGTAENVLEGISRIKLFKPDVVFLDIEMPKYSGLQLLNLFDEDINFEIIFTTAYSEYAVKAFELSAVDYVLKPISIDKMTMAIDRLKKKIDIKTMQNRLDALKTNLKEKRIEKIAIPEREGITFLKTDDIVNVFADGAYSDIYLTNGKKITASKKLKFFEEALCDHHVFFRVHRSTIVNMSCINNYRKGEGELIMDNGQVIKIARNSKADFEEVLKSNFKLNK